VTVPPPKVVPAAWRLQVTGLVTRPFHLTLGEILQMGSVEVDATLVCVHNPVGGDRIGTARCQGVRLSSILSAAGVSEGADHVVAHSVDGYSGGLPLSLLKSGFDPLLVYGMNGERLRPEHGGPVRLLVPGIYGYDANVKWLQRLDVTTFELAEDYWERRGWPREPAHVRTQSRIDVPAPAAVLKLGMQFVGGVAWGPIEGVSKVELSVDGGLWQQCELPGELSPLAWRHWRYRWDASPGKHSLRVRAWTREGVQRDGEGAPFPHGASGYHVVEVAVTAGMLQRDRLGELTSAIGRRVQLA
jgi:DMSO/TMAO reductase YedYZ molybdopterin-dependent catalytic subunit